MHQGGPAGAGGHQRSSNHLKNRIHTVRHSDRALRVSEEVRDAGDDADLGLGADGLQRGREDLHPAALDDLALLDERVRPAGVFVHMTQNVRIAEQRETIRLGHLEELRSLPDVDSRSKLFQLFFLANV